MKVLLVEDHEQVAKSTVMLLTLLGHEVEHARNGSEAILKAEEFLPELMLIDIGLPDMSGFEVAETLRGKAGLENMIMVALTGYDCSDKARVECFDHYYKKPMDFKVLERLSN